MFPKKEDLRTEFKSDLTGFPDADLIDAVVAFANTDGGTIFLGIEDDGTVTGILERHNDPIGVVAVIANKTVPSVSARAEVISDKGKNVLVIEVPRCKTVVASASGKLLKRRYKADGTPENVPMYPYEINIRLSELGMFDYTGRIMQNASLDDFSSIERERLRSVIRLRNGERALLELSDEELDKALGFVRDENGTSYPTVLGILMLAKEERLKELIPTAKASFQVLKGTKAIVNEEYHKPILATFELIENNMKAWNKEDEMEYGLIRIPIPDFSPSAFREALVNAFAHRDYTILRGIRIALEDEGLTVSSPGGFIDGVNIDNLLTVDPHGRNPALADVFKRIGLAEKTGRGIDRIYEGSIKFGRPLPDYTETTKSDVKLFIRRSNPDLIFMRMLADEENRSGRNFSINSLLVLSQLQWEKRLSLKELMEKTKISDSRIRAVVENLVEAGLIESIGNAKNREYILSEKVYKAQGKADEYSYISKDSLKKAEELVIDKARQQNGVINRNDVASLLHINDSQAYRILSKLKKDGKLELSGGGKYAKYKLK